MAGLTQASPLPSREAGGGGGLAGASPTWGQAWGPVLRAQRRAWCTLDLRAQGQTAQVGQGAGGSRSRIFTSTPKRPPETQECKIYQDRLNVYCQ